MPAGTRHPVRATLGAICSALPALLDGDGRRPAAAEPTSPRAYPAALETRDLPIVATRRRGRRRPRAPPGDPVDAADVLGAAALLRGADDPTDAVVARLHAAAARRLSATRLRRPRTPRGRALDRARRRAARPGPLRCRS